MSFIRSVENNYNISNLENRKPKGIGVSPYPLCSLIRYIANSLFNGLFSYVNPDRAQMKLLNKEGVVKKGDAASETFSLKVIFLGDIMVSKSGKPPRLNKNLKNLLKSADVIVANVESPVVNAAKSTKRGFSLKFEMNNSFLSQIYSVNDKAKWVFSVANNHACDNSRKNAQDVSGVTATIDNILSVIPDAEIIGAEIGKAKSTVSLQVNDGPKLGIMGWTEVMNHDKRHYKKKIIRETDLTDKAVSDIKKEHDLLIGFAHGNEEQSYYPLKGTRDRWIRLLDEKKFDVIVGHGPHTLQPAEQVGQGLLFHSIGNFCSPVGKSQTKVGCVPEITIRYQDKTICSTDYKIHLLSQKKESLSLFQKGDKSSRLPPRMKKRIKKIWKPLLQKRQASENDPGEGLKT